MSLACILWILQPLIYPISGYCAHLNLFGAVTLIDQQHGGPEFSMGNAANLCAREKQDMYNHTFDFSSDAVRLEVFAVETPGALHR